MTIILPDTADTTSGDTTFAAECGTPAPWAEHGFARWIETAAEWTNDQWVDFLTPEPGQWLVDGDITMQVVEQIKALPLDEMQRLVDALTVKVNAGIDEAASRVSTDGDGRALVIAQGDASEAHLYGLAAPLRWLADDNDDAEWFRTVLTSAVYAADHEVTSRLVDGVRRCDDEPTRYAAAVARRNIVATLDAPILAQRGGATVDRLIEWLDADGLMGHVPVPAVARTLCGGRVTTRRLRTALRMEADRLRADEGYNCGGLWVSRIPEADAVVSTTIKTMDW